MTDAARGRIATIRSINHPQGLESRAICILFTQWKARISDKLELGVIYLLIELCKLLLSQL